ncbi:right-handed parallel beta-helix repeat-containing protein [Roseibium marinum]|uniref:Right handed beta helix region n=1 Tax=Roseibium marinum TaxID=281252 RepID=A0A2S3ULN2_9HYPH|nr:right-handed parallel beta-helix repeat-containing protein [Roseibium marinum]POF28627.1 hypothetical protein CLV41_11240 [Roseibium marinum]
MGLEATPEDIHRSVLALAAGDELQLAAGIYRRPITLSGIRGTPDNPVILRGTGLPAGDVKQDIWSAAILGNGPEFEDYRKRGNEIARVEQAAGRVPGLHYIADETALFLKDCQWVIVENLSFLNCWPTAVYIDNCQNVTLRNLHFRGGTIAIGAIGTDTRHLLVEGCDWIQDPSGQGENDLLVLRRDGKLPVAHTAPGGKLWSELDWTRVHGYAEETGGPVDIENDARAYDGDFFRAWNVAGYAVFRDNCILDAFNGIHFFNTARKDEQEAYSRSVLIEKNWFVRLRDNAIEPEYYAVNWTMRHNCFADCFAPFSFEPERSGYFYIYGNLCWNLHRPGPADDDRNRGRSFKLGGIHEAIGPHYIMFNTFVLRGPVFKKKRISNLIHMNNVVGYVENDPVAHTDAAAPFGKDWRLPHDPAADWDAVKQVEKKRFTKFWEVLDITFAGDLINHPTFPDLVRIAGYPVGPGASGLKPVFLNGEFGVPEGLRIRAVHDGQQEAALQEALAVRIEEPDGASFPAVGEGTVIGAWQEDGLFTLDDPEFVRKNRHLQPGKKTAGSRMS